MVYTHCRSEICQTGEIMTKLEVCCYSVDCAQIAEKAGA
ncbi:copper homeostasis protein CutC, partial [Yersinia pestis]